MNNIIENNKCNKKISIVMAYINRKEQTILTLTQFNFLYLNKYDFEVIIVDDNSSPENDLSEIIHNYKFKIKLIKINKKTWINPVIAYNLGFTFIEGDIVILQNPEIFHCNDIIKISIEKLENNNNYYTFQIFASPDFEHNEQIKNLQLHNTLDYYANFISKINIKKFKFDYIFYKNKYDDAKELNYRDAYLQWKKMKRQRICNKYGIFKTSSTQMWYNHKIYNNTKYHFLSCFNVTLLKDIGGFCNDFKDGYCYDDDDLLQRISKITNIDTVESNIFFGIHQYHTNGSSEIEQQKDCVKKLNINKKIYESNKNNNVIYCDTIFNFDIDYNFIKNY
jgi:hypothetical protein